jgi:DNA transformation protein
MSALSNLPNVGKVLEDSLSRVGLKTPEQLKEVGAEDAFIRIRIHVDSGACLHMLYGIQGAIEGKRYTQLSERTKKRLKQLYNNL